MKSARWFNQVDRIIAGLWWWQLRRYLAKIKIDLAPEDSRQIDIAYREWKRYEFACKSGRPVDDQLAAAVETAIRAGIDPNALSLLIANRDISATDGTLQYRTNALLKGLGLLSRVAFFASSLLFSSLLALSPIPLFPKLIAFIVIFTLLIAAAYVLELYTNLPLAAISYLENQVSQSSLGNTGKVVSLHDHPAFSSAKGGKQK